MLTKITHEKGFQLIEMQLHDMHQIGSPGICDDCNKQMESGTFIGALNRIYCPACFKDWESKAVFYDQDVPFETKAINRLLTAANVSEN